ALAKSNFSGLRFREPVYRSLRELAMSYFESYFNSAGEKTLRSYTLPLDLRAFERDGWREDSAAMDKIAKRLDRLRRFPLLTPQMIRNLARVDKRAYEAGMLGVNPDGLFKVS